MCPFRFITVVFVLTITLTIFGDISASKIPLPCKECDTDEECNMTPPQLCVWGENKDFCGRRVCSKGPGEKCGGKLNLMGVCGEGLWCSHKNNRCHGCSIPTMTCYPD